MKEGRTMPYVDLVLHNLLSILSSVISYEPHIISTEGKLEPE